MMLRVVQTNRRAKKRILLATLVLVILIILFAGLKGKDKIVGNAFSWNQNNGIIFEGGTIAYTEPFIVPALAKQLNENGFEIELDLELSKYVRAGHHILTIPSAKNNETALTLWLWENQFIAMNGNDYDYSRRLPRITTKLDLNRHKVKVTSTQGKTLISVDGNIKEQKNFGLSIPTRGEGSRIILGNSVTRKNGWNGSLYEFSIYSTETYDENITAKLLGQYRFDEQQGRTVYDHSGFGHDLTLPARPPILERNLFAWELNNAIASKTSVFDIGLNFIGFAPLGLALMAFLRNTEKSLFLSIILTIASGFLISLLIEYSQSWMVARNSSLRDLILNTSGTFLGILLYPLYARLVNFFVALFHVNGSKNENSGDLF